VRRRRYEPARYTAALAVAAVIAGWALAQAPDLLPGYTIEDAAAPRDTLIAVVVAVIAGGIILFPSLAVLFRLTLAGHLFPGDVDAGAQPAAEPPVAGSRAARGAVAFLVVGLGFLTVADAAWAHAIGVVALLGFAVVGAAALIAPEIGEAPD
jgi:cytochrome d ubiquinol oxidase subunit II